MLFSLTLLEAPSQTSLVKETDRSPLISNFTISDTQHHFRLARHPFDLAFNPGCCIPRQLPTGAWELRALPGLVLSLLAGIFRLEQPG